MAKEKENTSEEHLEENADGQEEGANENNGTGESEIIVGFTMEEVDQMQADLEQARAEAQKNLEGWHRALADYNNLKRRTEQERVQMRGESFGKVILPFLDILDDLEIALQNKPTEGPGKAWGDGIELVYRKLQSRLEQQGLTMMKVVGEPFDPRLHEAITQEVTDEHESGHVIAAVKPGYMIGERVLRPAMVRVAA